MPTAKLAEIDQPAILIRISRLYRSNMTEEELYEATRGTWKIASKRRQLVLAMAVYKGIVKEVFQIRRWLPACSLVYKTRGADTLKKSGRYEFEGDVARDIRDKYVESSIKQYLGGGRWPLVYVKFRH
jgi:uncharacterized protein